MFIKNEQICPDARSTYLLPWLFYLDLPIYPIFRVICSSYPSLRAYLISKIKTFLLFSLYRGEHVHPELNHLDQIAEQNEGKLFFFRWKSNFFFSNQLVKVK